MNPLELLGNAAYFRANGRRLRSAGFLFHAVNIDARNREHVSRLFGESAFDMVIRCAAYPVPEASHHAPLDDFDVDAVGAINVPETTRALP